MKNILSWCLFLVLLSCDDDNLNQQFNNQQSDCDQSTIINSTQFNSTTANVYLIESLTLNANCMKIKVRENGCDGNSWTYELITDGIVDTSTTPATRKLKLKINNTELCLAQWEKERSFDIGNLQVSGQNSVKLIVEYYNNQTREIIYHY